MIGAKGGVDLGMDAALRRLRHVRTDAAFPLRGLVEFAGQMEMSPATALPLVLGNVPAELRGAHPLSALPVVYLLSTWLAECPAAREWFPELVAPSSDVIREAKDLIAWAKTMDGALDLIPSGEVIAGVRKAQPGDIAIFAFAHCGLVVTQSNRGIFTCVEGDASAGVWTMAKRARGVSALRFLLRLNPKLSA